MPGLKADGRKASSPGQSQIVVPLAPGGEDSGRAAAMQVTLDAVASAELVFDYGPHPAEKP
jgi:hypothetical protein